MLEARDITVTAGSARLLDGVSLSASAGSVTVVIGPNGAGKSTLLSVLAGERRPARGAVRLDGEDLLALPPLEAAKRRAVLPQSSSLDFPFRVHEVVRLGRAPFALAAPDPREETAVMGGLRAVDALHLYDRDYTTLSGGERQRVHLARVLAQLWGRPDRPGTRLLLLDEPTASLDLAHQVQVVRAARDAAATGAAVVAVVHDLNLAAAMADRIVALCRGRVAAEGGPRDALREDVIARVFGIRASVSATDAGRPLIRQHFS